mgnify:CR=1 FL=1
MFPRSDHANFAKFGVPIAFFFTGLHKDYHETTDTPDDTTTIEVEGKKLGPNERRRLAEAVEDRFRMFAGRDFCGRGSFEATFEHASQLVSARLCRW